MASLSEADAVRGADLRCLVHPGFPVASPDHAPCDKLPTRTVASTLRRYLYAIANSATRPPTIASGTSNSTAYLEAPRHLLDEALERGLELAPTPDAVADMLAELRAIAIKTSAIAEALHSNAVAARLQLVDVHARALAASSHGGESSWVNAERDRLEAGLDAAYASKLETLETQLHFVDRAIESLQLSSCTAGAAAADEALSDKDLISVWSKTHAPGLDTALAQAAAVSLVPRASAWLSLFIGRHSPAAVLASIATEYVRPEDVRIKDLRRVMLAIVPGETLTFSVELAEEARREPGFDAQKATTELLDLLLVDAVSVETMPRLRTIVRVTRRPEGKNWVCPECEHANTESASCMLCDFRTAPLDDPPPRQVAPESWPCPACTFINAPGRNTCEMCNSRPPAPIVGPAAPIMEVAPEAPDNHLEDAGTPVPAVMSLDLARPCIRVSLTLPVRAAGPGGVATTGPFLVVKSITVGGSIVLDQPAAATATGMPARLHAHLGFLVDAADSTGQMPCVSDTGTL